MNKPTAKSFAQANREIEREIKADSTPERLVQSGAAEFIKLAKSAKSIRIENQGCAIRFPSEFKYGEDPRCKTNVLYFDYHEASVYVASDTEDKRGDVMALKGVEVLARFPVTQKSAIAQELDKQMAEIRKQNEQQQGAIFKSIMNQIDR